MALTKVKTGQIGTDVIVAEDIAANAITVSELQDNAVTAAKLSVSGNGTSGQALTSDGDGTFSWTTITSDLVDDASPQLGAALDTNGNNITFGDSSSTSVNRLNFGAANDLSMYHDGSNSYIIDQGTGNLRLKAENLLLTTTTDENYLVGTANADVKLYYDNSVKLTTASGGVDITGTLTADGIDMEDNQKILLGASDDLQIYHNGSDSFIVDSGTGQLFIGGDSYVGITNAATNEFTAKFTTNGAVDLYYDNSVKLSTTSYGATFSGTGAIKLPVGTTAQQPTATAGMIRYDSDDAVVYYSDGTDWYKIAAAIPTLSSVTGTIYDGAASTLTLSGTNFLSSNLVVNFTQSSDGIDEDITVTPSSDTSATVSVSSAIYNNVTAGNTVTIKVTNSDAIESNSVTKNAVGIPSGGTLTTSGSTRIHTFTSSGTLTVPSGFSATSEYIVIAGGGGGGSHVGGGGGAGGMLESSSYTLSSTQSITIGAAGAGSTDTSGTGGSNGSNTTAFGVTATGGGRGGSGYLTGFAGGSGGGCGHGTTTNNSTSATGGGAATSGQGNRGGGGNQTGQHVGGGGGGKGGVGADGNSAGDVGGAGGVGKQNDINGTNHYWAAGGGGTSGVGGSATAGSGGLGGGGGAGAQPPGTVGSGGGSALNAGGNGSGYTGGNGGNNTGSGGGGGGHNNGDGGNGGKGIAIIAYTL